MLADAMFYAYRATEVTIRLAGACSRVALVDSDLGSAATVSGSSGACSRVALTLMGNR